MIEVRLHMPMANRRSWRRYLAEKRVTLPAVPRIGEDVLVTGGGWSERVKSVWWTPDEHAVTVEIGGEGTASGCVEFDVDNEDLRSFARDAGWDVG